MGIKRCNRYGIPGLTGAFVTASGVVGYCAKDVNATAFLIFGLVIVSSLTALLLVSGEET